MHQVLVGTTTYTQGRLDSHLHASGGAWRAARCLLLCGARNAPQPAALQFFSSLHPGSVGPTQNARHAEQRASMLSPSSSGQPALNEPLPMQTGQQQLQHEQHEHGPSNAPEQIQSWAQPQPRQLHQTSPAQLSMNGGSGRAAGPSARRPLVEVPGARSAPPPLPHDSAALQGSSAPPARLYEDLQQLLDALGLGYYAKVRCVTCPLQMCAGCALHLLPRWRTALPCAQVLESQGVGLTEASAMDDAALRKAGLVTPRARKLVVDELQRMGLRRAG